MINEGLTLLRNDVDQYFEKVYPHHFKVIQ